MIQYVMGWLRSCQPFRFAWTAGQPDDGLWPTLQKFDVFARLFRRPLLVFVLVPYHGAHLATYLGDRDRTYAGRASALQWLAVPFGIYAVWAWAVVPGLIVFSVLQAIVEVPESVLGMLRLPAELLDSALPEESPFVWRAVLAGTSPFTGCLPMCALLFAAARRHRSVVERRRANLREEADRHLDAGGSLDKLHVPERTVLPDDIADAVVHERKLLHLMNVSDGYRQAHKALLQCLPGLPRHVKRVLNRLRLLLYITYERDLYNKTPLTPAQLGKWVALQELWPELANTLTHTPELLATLEANAGPDNGGKFAQALELVTPPLPSDENLRTFLQKTPQLGSVVIPLTRFEPPPKDPGVDTELTEPVRAS